MGPEPPGRKRLRRMAKSSDSDTGIRQDGSIPAGAHNAIQSRDREEAGGFLHPPADALASDLRALAPAGQYLPLLSESSYIRDNALIMKQGSVRITRMDSAIIKRIVQELSLPEAQVAAAIALFESAASGSFIARYCREATGGLDEPRLRAIQERWIQYRELQERRAQLVKALTDQGGMTEELQRHIEDSWEKTDIEDLYHRVRPKKRNRAAEAIEKGLGPLAEYLWGQESDAWSPEEHADVFIDPEKGLTERQQVLQGACEIIADWIAERFDLRKALREMLWKEGQVVSTVVPAKAEQKTKYNMYYDRREPVASIPSHRVLAIRRGTKEGVLTSSIQCDSTKAIQLIIETIIRDRESPFAPILEAAARDCFSRILRPLIETEVRAQLKDRADREAIRVFQENLESLLLSPPCGPVAVIGIDAGKGEECRLAVVDAAGSFVEEAVVYPRPPKSEIETTRTKILDLIQRHSVGALAIGTGSGARETEMILRQILADAAIEGFMIATVNDAGVIVYSSSRIGREELPDLSVSTRTAVSTARRLQDPLGELVKIDPKLIGVGQYQHDVDQKELHRRLVQTVEYCVNRVGAELNKASFSLLRHIAGIGDRLARRIVTHRSTNGPFGNRAALASMPGMDPSTFHQAAGFLRMADSDSPLDRSSIHPNWYPIAEKMAASLNVGISDLLGNREVIQSLKLEEFVTETVGVPTLEFIREELLAPGKDRRGTYAPPRLRSEVRDISDLKEGMELEGTVTNVTNFGAFVDIGIHQDGLVHLSQMSNRFIRDPREVVKVGDLVKVKLISVEVETKRIGLSMKALLPAIPRRRKGPRRRPDQPSRPGSRAPASPADQAEGASGTTQSAASPAEGAPVPKTHPARRPRRREGRPRRDNAPRRERTQGGDGSSAMKSDAELQARQPKPIVPEQTLQEKIAILQSKFRGIQ